MSSGTPSQSTDFALLGHPASYEHLGDIFVHSRPDFNREKMTKYKATLEKIFEWTPSYAARDPLSINLADGRQIAGRLVFCTFLPETIHTPRKMLATYQKIRDGCRVAKDLGAKIIGLGGFTSIVGGTQGEKEAQELEVAVTSGNSLTAAVLGASGDIGRACALELATQARRILLIARNKAKLEELRDEMPASVEVFTSTDVQDATQASVIVAATSAAQPILAEADLQPGTVACDVGYPKNLSYAPNPRPDVLAISGGLAQMPFELDITYYTRLPAATRAIPSGRAASRRRKWITSSPWHTLMAFNLRLCTGGKTWLPTKHCPRSWNIAGARFIIHIPLAIKRKRCDDEHSHRTKTTGHRRPET